MSVNPDYTLSDTETPDLQPATLNFRPTFGGIEMDFSGPIEMLLINLITFLPKLVVALFTFGLGVVFSGFAARWTQQSLKSKISDPETLRLFSRLTRWAVLLITLIVALDQVNFDVTGFLTGLGIVGLTVGFALQDIAKNFVAGILLLVRQPFNIGDSVRVGNFTGTVADITSRDTVIKTWEGEVVIIPNTTVFENPIINYSESPWRRNSLQLNLGAGQDVARITALLLEVLHNLESVADDPAPTILAEALSSTALTLTLYFWVNQQHHRLNEVKSQVVLAIHAAAAQEGVKIG